MDTVTGWWSPPKCTNIFLHGESFGCRPLVELEFQALAAVGTRLSGRLCVHPLCRKKSVTKIVMLTNHP
jgi:hypothetical protein